MASRRWRVGGFAVALTLVLTSVGALAQTVGLQRLMREKLDRAESLLEAVVTSDWAGLEADAVALDAITRDAEWTVLSSLEYAERSDAFRNAVRDLIAAARSRDLEAAPQAYVDVTLSCVACHREVALARLAR